MAMTSPSDSGATGATGATGSTGSTGPAATDTGSTGTTDTPTKYVPKVGELVTDATYREKTDPNTGRTSYDLDADGNHVTDGPGDLVGVVVAVADDGTPTVAWFPPGAAYGSPLLPLIQ